LSTTPKDGRDRGRSCLARTLCGRAFSASALAVIVLAASFLSPLSLAADPDTADPPKTRMGDPWGMIYGGSGWWQDGPPDEMRVKCRQGAETYYKWGVRSSRVGVCWHNVEKVRGTYDWSSPDAALPAVADSGVRIVLCLATTPPWSWQYPEVAKTLESRGQGNLAGCLPHKAEYWPDYERYLTELVKRYHKYLKHYEIWNEPDGLAGFRFITDDDGKLVAFQHGGDPVWYAELVKRSYRIIKSIDPQARVGIGSYEKKAAMTPFTVDLKLAETLNTRVISDDLRKAFADQPDAPMSPEAFVSHVQKDQKWIITDHRNGRRFTITREKEKLKVVDPKTWFIEELYNNDIKDYYDAMSIHPYGNPFGREWIATVRKVMVDHGEGRKPLWVNEYSLKGKGVTLAFNTRRQLRLLRETPWISVAQPLVFACHLDRNIGPNRRSLRAHKQMSEEVGPRPAFVADFEGPLLKLLDHWEWNATGNKKGDLDQPELRSDYPHDGERCLVVNTPHKMVRLWFAPYVKADRCTFTGHLLVEPKNRNTKLTLSFGVESSDIRQKIREVQPLTNDVPIDKWFPFELAIDEQFPEWKDLAVVTCYVEIRSTEPGMLVSIDDVYVGPEKPAPDKASTQTEP